jgi:HK97 gp10 family phage protein
MKWSIRFEGGEELARTLNALPEQLTRKIVVDALLEAGQPMRRTMGQLAPREPGAPDLADNIGINSISRIGQTEGGRWRGREDQEHAVAIGPTKDFFYGLYQEYGTIHHGAQPFARPAFDSESNGALTILADELWWAIRRGIPASQERFA